MDIPNWKIESAEGPMSKGVCLKCGTTKPFKNAIVYSGMAAWTRIVRAQDNK